ncbi:DUF5667 domain-containing protein [Actinokineospora sp. NBRC 105648]|uniref:DUF5667 domain-containing protein n=1 Tax=Actinokineospora sp. NBRC 105648 TaxID=3032206 RepID=UPI0024A5AEF2|nr:DUF5667 domain-containing protein [Actinokineospora sp. NBRC 105648]GLZ38222.1 hypothetical protein Acsp05_18460 [Actinokineospora sp. NBRC 105648]
MVDSGAGPSGPRGERADSPHAGRSHPGLVDDLGPEFSDDDRAIVELLAGLGPLSAPDAGSRDRMRAKVMASLAADPVEAAPPPPARPPRAGRAPRGRPDPGTSSATRPAPVRGRPDRPANRPGAGSGARARFAVAAVAVLALVFSLTGMSLLLARDALPGDALYGVKRTGEAASLGLTFGDEEKAFKHLEFATARITEIETLALRSADPADAPTDGYVSALSDFDNDATAGTRALTAVAIAGDGRQLPTLRTWADQQGARLAALRPRFPAPAESRLAASLALLDKIESRSAGLISRFPCYQVVSGDSDEIGVLPATATCQIRPGAPQVLPAPDSQAGNAPATGSPGTPAGTVAPPQTTGANPPGQATTTAPTASPTTSTRPPVVPIPPIIGGPTTTRPPGSTTTAPPPVQVPVPLPLPTIALPPLLPGLPGIVIG